MSERSCQTCSHRPVCKHFSAVWKILVELPKVAHADTGWENVQREIGEACVSCLPYKVYAKEP